MIVCTKCGFQNEDTDTFCGSCAAFLEWSGERVEHEEAEPEPQPEPEPGPQPEQSGFIDRVKDRMGIGEPRQDGEAAPAPATAPAQDPAPAPVGAGGPPAASPAGPAVVPAPASTPVVPAASAAPAATPAPVSPTAARSATPPLVSPPPPVPPAGPAPLDAMAPTPPQGTPGVETGERPGAAAGVGAVAAAAATTTEPNHTETPPPVQPGAVKPTAVSNRPAPKTRTAPTRVVNPGDLVCGQCGEGNEPHRKFCRRCGASLQRAAVFYLPWYKRWWRSLTTKKSKAAGDRPRSKRRAFGGSGRGWVVSWLGRILGIAIVVLVVLSFSGPWHNALHNREERYYHDVIGAVHPNYTAVHPLSAAATSSARGHPPGFAIDGAVNTSWQTNGANPLGQSLLIRLASPTNLDKIGFLNGDQDTPQAYLTEPRPELIHMTFLSKPTPGHTTKPYSKSVTLKDTASFQTFTLDAKDVSSITITIGSVYESNQGTHAAIAEVELFVKKL